jgi:hypothetical protein
MRPVRNNLSRVVPTFGVMCNHRANCEGDWKCQICGRRMCWGCKTHGYYKQTGMIVCLICSGIYTPETIALLDD